MFKCIQYRTILIPLFVVGFLLSLSFVLTAQESNNPPMPGFNQKDSDPRAIKIADRVMQALGGRDAWDNTRYLQWRFFGRRLHIWDKWTGRLRLESGDLLILMNINTRTGKVWKEGEAITHPDSLQKYLDFGYKAWINDSYWLLMPYKLKDTGVTLRYAGEAKTEDGRIADILHLTFKDVGVTPQNKYLVYVDRETGLVTQWSFFANASDREPSFTVPWRNWKRYGNIMLSGDRGKRQITDIAVYETLPDSIFTSPNPIHLNIIEKQ